MRKFVLVGFLIALVLIVLAPMAVYAAPSYPVLNGRTYYAAGSYEVYDMDGNKVATYRGMSVVFSSQASADVGGTVRLYQASNIRGTYLTGGTGTIYLQSSLAEGNNTVVVMSNGGDLSLVLPAGVTGIATSGSAAVTGSPLSLAAGGTRTIPTTTSGLFTLALSRSYSTAGQFVGKVGQNVVSKPRFQLAGTQPYASAAAGTATLDGGPIKCFGGSTTLYVSVAGTVNITVPYGMVGTATSGTATIAGSPVALPAGTATQIDTGATTGTVTIALNALASFNIAGTMAINSTGACTKLKGRADGFIVTDLVNFYVYSMNESISLVYTP